MKLVIDGYNLIRQSPTLSQIELESLEAGREALIRYLQAYRRLKRHDITVVFDGEHGKHLSLQKEKIGAITVIYSGRGQKADDVIKEIVERQSNLIVISSDKEIVSFAERHNANAVLSAEFISKLEMAIYGKGTTKGGHPSKIVPKKKGPSRRLSKRERRRLRVLKKL